MEVGWRRDQQAPVSLAPTGIVIHHMEETTRFNDVEHELCLARLRHWFIFHVHERKWSDLGYHALICPHGVVFEGRRGGFQQPLQGAHAVKNNDSALGIALLGNYERHEPTKAALNALRSVVAEICRRYGIAAEKSRSWNYVDDKLQSRSVTLPNLIGHRDVRQTICPGDTLYRLLPQLREETEIS